MSSWQRTNILTAFCLFHPPFSEWDGNKRFDKTKNTSHRNRGKTISVDLFGKSLTQSGYSKCSVLKLENLRASAKKARIFFF